MTAEDKASKIELPGFVLDFERDELRTAEGMSVGLRPQVLAVLKCLARRLGSLVPKDELMLAVWPTTAVTDDSLVQCIGELRRALKDDAHRIVQTEARRGYRLMPAPTVVDAAPVPAHDRGFHQDIRFATTPDGVRLAHATSGQGAPLVRAAHWMSHLDWDWRSATLGPRIQELSKRHRYLRYDGRGYGLSDWEAAAGTLDECVHDLETVVNSAGLERFALLGASGGAPISIRYAARHPQRVTHLVLLGGFARGARRRGSKSVSIENFEAMLLLLEDGWAQDNPAFRQLMTTMFWPGATAEQMDSFNQLQRVSCPPKTAVALLRRIADFDATEDMPRVMCPTLVLHSPRDSRVPFEEGRLIAATIPGARLEPFDSPNHTPLVDEAAFAQVQNLIEEFLAETDRVDATRPDMARHTLRAIKGGRDDASDPASGSGSH